MTTQTLKTPFFRWIYENHQGHHVLGGKCNYNVCCPGWDHLLGTYVPTSVWRTKMNAVPPMGAVERWGAAVEPLGVPQAPIRKAVEREDQAVELAVAQAAA